MNKKKRRNPRVIIYTGDPVIDARIEQKILKEVVSQKFSGSVTIETVTKHTEVSAVHMNDPQTRPDAVVVKLEGDARGLGIIMAARHLNIPAIVWVCSTHVHLKKRCDHLEVIRIPLRSHNEQKGDLEKIALVTVTALKTHSDDLVLEAQKHGR